jgi:hypothetical protein
MQFDEFLRNVETETAAAILRGGKRQYKNRDGRKERKKQTWSERGLACEKRAKSLFSSSSLNPRPESSTEITIHTQSSRVLAGGWETRIAC